LRKRKKEGGIVKDWIRDKEKRGVGKEGKKFRESSRMCII
jgi:hypothetical protein